MRTSLLFYIAVQALAAHGFHRIRVYNPPGDEVFTPNAAMLSFSLQQLVSIGYLPALPVETVRSVQEDPESLYVMTSMHHLSNVPLHFVIYNLEQLCIQRVDIEYEINNVTRFMDLALDVWDYSANNVACLEERYGRTGVRLIPVGYSPVLELKSPVRRPIDVLFLGGVNAVRSETLYNVARLAASKDRIYRACSACWQDERFSGRIGINLPYFRGGNRTLEVNRIIPWVTNRVYTISMAAPDPYYMALMEGLVDIAQDEDEFMRLVDAALSLDPAELSARAEERYAKLKERLNFTDLLFESGAGRALLDILEGRVT